MPGLLHTDLPIVAAPMAGGPSTPALVSAVVRAGGFAFLAGGYKTVAAMSDEIRSVRELPTFGVNLFVPQRDASGALRQIDPAEYRAYAAELAEEAALFGLQLSPEPVTDDDDWDGKFAALVNDPVPVVSLTFGLPAGADIAALRTAGSLVLATVTTVREARAAEAADVDGLIVQGPRAGGHSATFDPGRTPGSSPTLDVLKAVRAAVSLPLIATGGVDGPRTVTELIHAGADSVAVGTLLLAADEAGTADTHRAALADPRFTGTVITRAFTGRPARALRNHFIDRYEPFAPTAPARADWVSVIRRGRTSPAEDQFQRLISPSG